MIEASIIGITGYAGIELFRLLRQHPRVKIRELISNSNAGKKLADVYPQFTGEDEIFLQEYDPEKVSESDIVFTALPHGVSQEIVGELYKQDTRIVDLSGDFRYQKVARYEKWYEVEHQYPQFLSEAVYGLVEINRSKIKNANLVGNPGCYPTASLLGLMPLVKEDLTSTDSIIIDAKSGVSGAGRSLKKSSHFCEADESIKAYKIANHRHTSEIESVLEDVSGNRTMVSFTPHLVPMKRGILATIYLNLKRDIKETKVLDIYNNFYANDEFVQVLTASKTPETKYVAGTNYCHLGVKLDDRNKRLVIVSTIDNLGKGAAGQAVQNMNIMFGFSEQCGLEATGVFP